MKRFLITQIKVIGYNKVEVFQDGTKVRTNGNFSLPKILKEFKTPEEAKAYIEGIVHAAIHYGEADVSCYMKEFDL